MTTTFSEDFSGGTWGNWTTAAQGTGSLTVVSGQGKMTAGGVGFAADSALATMTAQGNSEVLLSFNTGSIGGGRQCAVILRHGGSWQTGDPFRPQAGFGVEISMTGWAIRVYTASNNFPVGSSVSLALSDNTTYWVRFRVMDPSPYTCSARVWADGSAEPGSWQATGTDSAAYATGKLALSFQTSDSGGSTREWLFDNIVLTDAAAATGAQFPIRRPKQYLWKHRRMG